MRVCLTAWHFTGYAGTQTWGWTVGRALKALGHKVTFYCTQRREMAMRLFAEGLEVYSTPKPILADGGWLGGHPATDLVISSQPRMFHICPICGRSEVIDDDFKMPKHKSILDGKHCLGSEIKAKDVLPSGKRLYVCHGWLPHERPVQDGNPYVAISAELQENLRKEYEIEATVVGQPIDLERFRSVRPLRTTKPKAYLLSTWPAAEEMVTEACADAGVEILKSQIVAGRWGIPERINEADIVIGTGRGIWEAMACGRLAVICGTFGCDGVANPDDWDKQIHHNLSGRATNGDASTELVKALKAYDSALGDWGRTKAEECCEPQAIAKRLLEAA